MINMKLVLQKFIAQSGYCSRRQAEELIKKGRVLVNGKIAEPGMKADETDEVKIGGKRLALRKKMIYIKLNKPKGYVSTSRKFKGEKNIFDLVDIKERLFAAGRLDKDSRGLILLTNDGELVNELTHPRYEHEKRYLAIVERIGQTGRISTNKKRICTNHEYELITTKFTNGVDIGEGDGIVKAKDAKRLGGGKFLVVLTEGKKRQIRRMFKALDFQVVDLVRISIGGLEQGNLQEGQWEYLSDNEMKKLKKSLQGSKSPRGLLEPL